MGRAKLTIKNPRLKKEKIELQKNVEARTKLVIAANKQKDPLDALPSFKKVTKNGITWNQTVKRVNELDEDEKKAVVDLLICNMKTLYEKSNWGWNEKNIREEMFEEAAWYLIVKNEEGKICGFSHFRFDMDCDAEVLYVYEIQIEQECQRKGLGKFMMQVMEMLMMKADLRKIMLTNLICNESATIFFKNTMKFEIDESNPAKQAAWNKKYKTNENLDEIDFEILSKINKRKANIEAMEKLSLQSKPGSRPDDDCCPPNNASRRGGG